MQKKYIRVLDNNYEDVDLITYTKELTKETVKLSYLQSDYSASIIYDELAGELAIKGITLDTEGRFENFDFLVLYDLLRVLIHANDDLEVSTIIPETERI